MAVRSVGLPANFGMILFGLVALGSLTFLAIQAASCFWPSWERSGPLEPPFPPSLWQPVHNALSNAVLPAAIWAGDGLEAPGLAADLLAFLGAAVAIDPPTTSISAAAPTWF